MIDAFFVPAAMLLVLQGTSIIELTEPRGPEIKTHTLDGRCGADLYRFVYLMGTALDKNYISEISINGVAVHEREFVKFNPVIQNRFDLQGIRFGHCNPNGQRGVEFFVETSPDKPNTVQLKSNRFIMSGGRIVRAIN